MCADELAHRSKVFWKKPLLARAQVAEVRLRDFGVAGESAAEKLILVKPLTYMNDSGIAVRKLASFAKVPPDHVIVVHDELDLIFGTLRLKFGGGDNGHNGLKSVRAHLGTGDYYRVRIGIGRPAGSQDPIDYVLGKFPKKDATELALTIGDAADAVLALLTDGLANAQNRFN
jgi:PTH1 family peptidyl-tRNA hydrolase